MGQETFVLADSQHGVGTSLSVQATFTGVVTRTRTHTHSLSLSLPTYHVLCGKRYTQEFSATPSGRPGNQTKTQT